MQQTQPTILRHRTNETLFYYKYNYLPAYYLQSNETLETVKIIAKDDPSKADNEALFALNFTVNDLTNPNGYVSASSSLFLDTDAFYYLPSPAVGYYGDQAYEFRIWIPSPSFTGAIQDFPYNFVVAGKTTANKIHVFESGYIYFDKSLYVSF